MQAHKAGEEERIRGGFRLGGHGRDCKADRGSGELDATHMFGSFTRISLVPGHSEVRTEMNHLHYVLCGGLACRVGGESSVAKSKFKGKPGKDKLKKVLGSVRGFGDRKTHGVHIYIPVHICI